MKARAAERAEGKISSRPAHRSPRVWLRVRLGLRMTVSRQAACDVQLAAGTDEFCATQPSTSVRANRDPCSIRPFGLKRLLDVRIIGHAGCVTDAPASVRMLSHSCAT
jgi:hypothetical protein